MTAASNLARAVGHATTRGVALLLFPVAGWQGIRVRRATPRLPEAAGERSGGFDAGNGAGNDTDDDTGDGVAFRLLVLGESTAVGVGVTDLADGLGHRLAAELAERRAQRIDWHLVGRSGVTVAAWTAALLPDLPDEQDLIVVVFGVNDTLRLRSRRAWRADVTHLLGALRPRLAPQGRIAVLGVPDFASLPALPDPLRTVLHRHARALDRALIDVVARSPGCVHVPAIPLPEGDYLSHDRFHPNAAAYAVWAAHIARSVA